MGPNLLRWRDFYSYVHGVGMYDLLRCRYIGHRLIYSVVRTSRAFLACTRVKRVLTETSEMANWAQNADQSIGCLLLAEVPAVLIESTQQMLYRCFYTCLDSIDLSGSQAKVK
jgi:hypothetical protein